MGSPTVGEYVMTLSGRLLLLLASSICVAVNTAYSMVLIEKSPFGAVGPRVLISKLRSTAGSVAITFKKSKLSSST